MRRKQTGPEIKLFELDTLKYITKDNVNDYIHYIGIYPERMAPADVTFARKSGLLDSSNGTLHLSKVALHYVLKAISYREYAFLILTKQWIKTTYVGGELPTYNEPLLTRILEEILTAGKMSVKKFSQEMDEILSSRYAPTPLSNLDSLRYIRNLLISSELVIIENECFTINPLATAIAKDLIINKNNFNSPNETTEFETFWNSMSNGIFDIITEENKDIYTSFYPNLIK